MQKKFRPVRPAEWWTLVGAHASVVDRSDELQGPTVSCRNCRVPPLSKSRSAAVSIQEAVSVVLRESDWIAAPIPADLAERRIEITRLVDRKIIINAMNSGPSVFMADFDDSKLAHLAKQAAWSIQSARRRERHD